MRTRMAVAGLFVSMGLLSGCGAVSTVGVPVTPAQSHVDETTVHQAVAQPDEPTPPAQTTPPRPTSTGVPRGEVIVGSTKQAPGQHIALTFDDGPDPKWTPQVLALLAQYNVKATFCIVGTNAKAHPELVRAIAAAGHALCDHTMHHDAHLPTQPPAIRHSEIADGRQAILDAVPDAKIPYYRAPAGAFSKPGDPDPDTIQRIAATLDMQPLGWSIDTLDWTKPGAPAIVAAIQRAGTHDVVLLHDAGGNRDQTITALRTALPWLVQRGFQFDFPA
jgi:peptidoglycan/xylan/chitin deacetylase (PgdA/CDA1 family)